MRPRLSRKARMRPDPRDGRPVLLSPERGLRLSDTAAAVVSLCDGAHSVDEMVDALASRFGADRARVAVDVEGLLADLRARVLLDMGDAPPPGAPGRGASSLPCAEGRREAFEAARPHAEGPACVPPEGGPYTLVAELTHRCPLACPYCSNPRTLVPGSGEMSTGEWQHLVDDASALGVMQVHLTGGEPLARADLEAIARHARSNDLYVSLVTSGVPLDRARLERLAPALDHVQLSIQDARADRSDIVAGRPSHEAKRRVAAWVAELGLPLTLNVVLHRGNVDRVGEIVAMAEHLGADRLELANVQLVSWALANADALLPTRVGLEHARAAAEQARARLSGRMEVVFVLPDWYAGRPRACMDGWAKRFVVVAPDGVVLPCHGARALPLPFESARSAPLARIWHEGPAMRAFRGQDWMLEPCRSCDRRTLDFGGCRCQAFALTGDARSADPACALAPMHSVIRDARARAERSSAGHEPRWLYRGR